MKTTLAVELTEAEAQRIMVLVMIDAKASEERYNRAVRHGTIESLDVIKEKMLLANKMAEFSFSFPVADQPGK